jgi:hypothetical protein
MPVVVSVSMVRECGSDARVCVGHGIVQRVQGRQGELRCNGQQRRQNAQGDRSTH